MYEHIFFDLDRTLWDFETNSLQTLTELADKYKLRERGIHSVEQFVAEYFIINNELWDEYIAGRVDKDTLRYQRFYRALLPYNIDDQELSRQIGNDYTSLSPHKTNLLAHTKEVLEYLRSKYILHIITNGFEEVQYFKMRNSGIEGYFREIITSDRAGFLKPHPGIFEFSLKAAGANAANSLMIGDSLEADIAGARNAGMHQVYLNTHARPHQQEVTYEIRSLDELMRLL